MPLTLHVGITKKVGLPHYGSAGASCGLQVELDSYMLHDQPVLESKIRSAFAVCEAAVEQQLAPAFAAPSGQPQTCACTTALGPSPEPVTGDAQPADTAPPLATERQISFLCHLARQCRTLGMQRLKLVADQLYSHSLEELTAAEASQLIDLLKEVRAGTRLVEDLLPAASV